MKLARTDHFGFVHVWVFALVIVVVAGTFGVYNFILSKNLQTGSVATTSQELPRADLAKAAFTFSAAGDFGTSSNASAVLTKIGETKPDFTLALGDLGYGGNGTENSWCDFVHQKVGTNHPFQIVAGNHDDGTSEGNILEYRKCLPNKIDGVVGDYGLEYYFDYNKLARFILISPDIDELGYTYEKGTPHYQWLNDTISDAREQQIPWVILGMHKNCISIGVKTCEIGQDLLNLAVEKRVDIVLQGHEHSYSRSKQLQLSSGCPAILINEFNSKCVAGSGNKLLKGASTIVISGAGGYELRDINTKDEEIGYFEAWNGKNIGRSYGFTLFKVEGKKIIGEFIPAVGDFSDKFEISSR